MERIEQARELFENLETNGSGCAGEIAKRAFQIQERLAEVRG